MADITVSFTNPTATEQRAAQHVLALVNQKRQEMEPPLAEFASFSDYVADQIQTRWVPTWIRMEADYRAEQENLIQKFLNFVHFTFIFQVTTLCG